MEKIRCNTCVGTGQIMGVGMMPCKCHNCNGMGKIYPEGTDNNIDIDRNSESYKEAIEKLKALDSSITDEKAEEMFNSEFSKIEEITDKKGSRRKKNKT